MLVASIGLGIGFLQQDDPQLLIAIPTSTEDKCFPIRFDWNIAIDFDQFPDSIHTQPDKKVSVLDIDVFEDPLDQMFVFS